MISLVTVFDLFAVLSFIAALWAIRDHRWRGGLPYPPGPPSLPIIGNLFDIPKEFSWLAYTQFSKKHGTSLSLNRIYFYNWSGREYHVFPYFREDHHHTEHGQSR